MLGNGLAGGESLLLQVDPSHSLQDIASHCRMLLHSGNG